MGLPNINIEFTTLGITAIQRSQKGTVAIILQDAVLLGAHVITNITQIPETLSAANKEYVQRAFLGYQTPPKQVLLYVLDTIETEYTDALTYFETQRFDYLVGAPDCSVINATAIATWIKLQRLNGFGFKAVLPNEAVDSEGIVNFATTSIIVGATTFTTAQYCSRIAGLLAGTPMTISCTFAPLPEVTDCTRLTKAELDTAIDAGELVLYHDGERVKIARGVNSFVTEVQGKGVAYKKIKIVEAIDMMRHDIKITAEDSYIGKYANSYDNKCLLISAIRGYFLGLENDGILDPGKTSIGIDIAAQEAYLISIGTDTSKLTEQQIKESNTADKVYLTSNVKILDAIEDIELDVYI